MKQAQEGPTHRKTDHARLDHAHQQRHPGIYLGIPRSLGEIAGHAPGGNRQAQIQPKPDESMLTQSLKIDTVRGKGSAVIEEMRPDAMTLYGRICGQTLARAHARSGDRVAIAVYLGGRDRFDNAIADFAETYADLNERDHSALTDAITAGRVEAHLGT